MANRAYKFRIYPNDEQKILFAKTFGCVRMVYNHWLDRKTLYVRKDFSSFTDAIDFHSSIFRKKKLNISI